MMNFKIKSKIRIKGDSFNSILKQYGIKIY